MEAVAALLEQTPTGSHPATSRGGARTVSAEPSRIVEVDGLSETDSAARRGGRRQNSAASDGGTSDVPVAQDESAPEQPDLDDAFQALRNLRSQEQAAAGKEQPAGSQNSAGETA